MANPWWREIGNTVRDIVQRNQPRPTPRRVVHGHQRRPYPETRNLPQPRPTQQYGGVTTPFWTQRAGYAAPPIARQAQRFFAMRQYRPPYARGRPGIDRQALGRALAPAERWYREAGGRVYQGGRGEYTPIRLGRRDVGERLAAAVPQIGAGLAEAAQAARERGPLAAGPGLARAAGAFVSPIPGMIGTGTGAVSAAGKNVGQLRIAGSPLPGRAATALGEAGGLLGGGALQLAAIPAAETERAIGGTAVGLEAARQARQQGLPLSEQARLAGAGFQLGREALGPVAYTTAYEQAAAGARAIGGPESGTLAPLTQTPAPAGIERARRAREMAEAGATPEEIAAEVGRPVVEAAGQVLLDPLNLLGVGATKRRQTAEVGQVRSYFTETDPHTYQEIDQALSKGGRPRPVGFGGLLEEAFGPQTQAARGEILIEDTTDIATVLMSRAETPEQRVNVIQQLLDLGDPNPETANAARAALADFGNIPQSRAGKQATVFLRRLATDPTTGAVDPGIIGKIIGKAETPEDAALALVRKLEDAAGEFYKVKRSAKGGLVGTGIIEQNPIKRAQSAITAPFIKYAHLGINPAFGHRNLFSNRFTAAVDGLLPLASGDRIAAWTERFGYRTRAATRAIGGASGLAAGETIQTTKRFKPISMKEVYGVMLKKESWKEGPVLAFAQAAEQYESERVWYKATRDVWDRSWKYGKVIPANAAVDNLPPDVRNWLIGRVTNAMDQRELQDIIRQVRSQHAIEPWRVPDENLMDTLRRANPDMADGVLQAGKDAADPEDFARRLDDLLGQADEHTAAALADDTPIIEPTDPAAPDVMEISKTEGTHAATATGRRIAAGRQQRDAARVMAWTRLEDIPEQARQIAQQVGDWVGQRIVETYRAADDATAQWMRREISFEESERIKRNLWDTFARERDAQYTQVLSQLGDQGRPLIVLRQADDAAIAQAAQAKNKAAAVWSRYRAGEIPYDHAKLEVENLWQLHNRYAITQYDQAWQTLGGAAERGPVARIGLDPIQRSMGVLRADLAAAALEAGIPGVRMNKAGELVPHPKLLNTINRDLEAAGLERVKRLSDLDAQQVEAATAAMHRRADEAAGTGTLYQRAPKPKQQQMFEAGEELPLFSQTPQQAQLEQLKEIDAPGQGHLPGMKPTFEELADAQAKRRSQRAALAAATKKAEEDIPRLFQHVTARDTESLFQGTPATPEAWANLATSLRAQADDWLTKGDELARGVAVSTQRGKIQDIEAFGTTIRGRVGGLSARQARELERSMSAEARAAALEEMGRVLSQAGLDGGEINALDFQQRRRVLEEIGRGELLTTGAGDAARIGELAPERRQQLIETARDLADEAATTANDPLTARGYALAQMSEDAQRRAEALARVAEFDDAQRADEIEALTGYRQTLEEMTAEATPNDLAQLRPEMADVDAQLWALRQPKVEPAAISATPSLPTGPYTADRLHTDLVEQFGLSNDEADAVSRLAEARAQAWSKVTGKDAGEWYSTRLAGIQQGGDVPASAYFQRAPSEGSPEFRNWFRGSRVVDDWGRPKIMYHGTAAPGFEEFDPAHIDPGALFGPGYYFTGDPEVAGGALEAAERWTYHPTQEAAMAAPGRTGYVWKEEYGDHAGEWIARVEQPELTHTGYAQGAYAKGIVPDADRERWASTIRNSTEYKRAMGRGYLTEGERENVRRAVGEFLTNGDKASLQQLKWQPYNIPTDSIIARTGLEGSGGVYPVYMSLTNPFDMDRSLTRTRADILMDFIEQAIPEGDDVMRNAARGVRQELATDFTGAVDVRHETVYKEFVYQLGRSMTDGEAKTRMQQLLKDMGYDGITHVGGKRVGWKEHRVFIAFDPTQVKSPANIGTWRPDVANILQQKGLVGAPKGAVQFLEDGRAIISAFDGSDVSTAVHEMGHIFRRDLEGADLARVEKWAGVQPGGEWSRIAEEKFARGFERYLADGTAPLEELKPIFERFREWLGRIYRVILGSDIDVDVTKEVRAVFDRLLTGDTPPAERVISDLVSDLTETQPARAAMSAENVAHIEPTLQQIKAGIQAAPAAEVGKFDPRTAQQVENWLKSLTPRLNETKAIAAKVGSMERDRTLLNYADKRLGDQALSYFMLYSYWPTRTVPNWARRIANNPAILSRYLRYKQAIRQVNSDLPEWWRDQVGINLFGNPMYVNLEQTLNPLYAQINDFEDRDRGGEGRPLGEIMQTVGNLGIGSVWPPLQMAYALALAQRGDVEGAQAWTSYVGSPQRTLRYATAMLKEAGVPGIPAGGVVLEPWLWTPGTMFQGGDKWERRRFGKALYDLYREGTITYEQMVDSAYTQSGDVWEQAMQRATMQRAPGAVVGFLFGQGFKTRQAYEIDIDRASEEFYTLMGQLDTLTPEQKSAAFDAFYGKYPWYGAVQMSKKKDQERDIAIAWDTLRRLPPGNDRQKIIEAAKMDPDLLSRFFDDADVDLEGWNQNDRARFMSSVLDIAAILKVPNAMTKEAWKKVQQRNRAMWAEIEKKWPDYQSKNDQYWRIMATQGEDAGRVYLNSNPDLLEAWSYKTKKITTDPLLFSYYGDQTALEKAATNDLYTELDRRFPGARAAEQEYYRLKDAGQDYKGYLEQHPELRDYWDFKRIGKEFIEAYPPEAPRGTRPPAPAQLRPEAEAISPTQQAVAEAAAGPPAPTEPGLEAARAPGQAAPAPGAAQAGLISQLGWQAPQAATGQPTGAVLPEGSTTPPAAPGETYAARMFAAAGDTLGWTYQNGTADELEKQLVSRVYDEADRRYPGGRALSAQYGEMKDAGASKDELAAFRDAHPDMLDYWDFTGAARDYIDANKLEPGGTRAELDAYVNQMLGTSAGGLGGPIRLTKAGGDNFHLGPRRRQYEYRMKRTVYDSMPAWLKSQLGGNPYATPLYGARGGGGGGGGYYHGGGYQRKVSPYVLRKMSPALLAQLRAYFAGGSLGAGALRELAALGISNPETLRSLFVTEAPRPAPSGSKSSSSRPTFWRVF